MASPSSPPSRRPPRRAPRPWTLARGEGAAPPGWRAAGRLPWGGSSARRPYRTLGERSMPRLGSALRERQATLPSAMLGTQNLAKSYGARALFEDVSLKLNPGSRYGLVGANGSGKTTFLKILAGDEPATLGFVSIPKEARLSFLQQDRFLSDDDIILDVTMMGDRLVWDALSEQRRIIEGGAGDAGRIAELEDTIRTHD